MKKSQNHVRVRKDDPKSSRKRQRIHEEERNRSIVIPTPSPCVVSQSHEKHDPVKNVPVLHWPVGPHSLPVPSQAESNLLPLLLRWGKTEHGMMRSQPPFRLPQIQQACRKNRIELLAALSLRRTHMKYMNPTKRMSQLGLGREEDIREAAVIFEQAVGQYLTLHNVHYLTEEQQKQRLAEGEGRGGELFLAKSQSDAKKESPFEILVLSDADDEYPQRKQNQDLQLEIQPTHMNQNLNLNHTEQQQELSFIDTKAQNLSRTNSSIGYPTPDFLFLHPIELQKVMVSHPHPHRHHDTHDKNHTSSYPKKSIHWLEAKMFYGASTIPQGTSNAVGNILAIAQKYVSYFGPGAMVFSYGCGDQLAHALEQIHVEVVDAYPLDLKSLYHHQQTWCADSNGTVLF